MTLAAWASVPAEGKILDVGTGCGVIALICAQRSAGALIDAIDIDSPSIEEAIMNFSSSPWQERLTAKKADFIEEFGTDVTERYDLIISNPPFFDSGANPEESARLRARHKGSLSPETILDKASRLLSDKGIVAMIVPADQSDEIVRHAETRNLFVKRSIFMSGRRGKEPKRFLVEFCRIKGTIAHSEVLYIKDENDNFSEEYKRLCKDLYLAF